jgi:hypothetical protein
LSFEELTASLAPRQKWRQSIFAFRLRAESAIQSRCRTEKSAIRPHRTPQSSDMHRNERCIADFQRQAREKLSFNRQKRLMIFHHRQRGSRAKDHSLKQGIRGQPISAMHARASHFASRIKPLHGRPTCQVRADTAH